MPLHIHHMSEVPTQNPKILLHSRWYFISWPMAGSTPSRPILEAAEHIVYHFTSLSPDNPHENIVCGYTRLKQRYSVQELQVMSGFLFQWIPAIFVSTVKDLPVDFSQWAKEDFDLDKFLQVFYPWEEISDLIYNFQVALLQTPTLCSNKDSVVIYI